MEDKRIGRCKKCKGFIAIYGVSLWDIKGLTLTEDKKLCYKGEAIKTVAVDKDGHVINDLCKECYEKGE